ncbi:MAG: hypothetical protein FWC70_06895 [Defluviitaleaceae bacterium]|nr:hypothetical protein [Defluviitaleaceae bacterium]
MKKVKKFLSAMLVAALLLPGVPVFADEQEVVVFTYDEAVSLILDEMLLLQDLDRTIRDMQLQRRFLDDELRRLQTRGENFEMRFMREMLWELESGIVAARAGQAAIEGAAAQTLLGMETALGNLTQPGSEADMATLQMSMAAIVGLSSPDLSSQIAMMQSQRNDLNTELNRLREPQMVEELTRSARHNLNEFDRQADILRMHREQAELSMELALRNIIVGMAELDRLEGLLEAGISLMEIGLSQMEIMHDLGFVSTNTLNAAAHNLAQNGTQLEELRRGRQNLMQTKNELLGQSLFQDTVINFERVLPEMPEDLEAHIQSMVGGTHAVRMSQFDLDRARGARWVYTGNHRDITISANDRARAHDPNFRSDRDIWRLELTRDEEQVLEIRDRIMLQESAERAAVSHEQTIRATEATILRGYRELETLIAQYENLHSDTYHAMLDLNAALTGYALGQVTALEVEQARMGLFQIESQKESILNQKWVLAFRLENPVLL